MFKYITCVSEKKICFNDMEEWKNVLKGKSVKSFKYVIQVSVLVVVYAEHALQCSY